MTTAYAASASASAAAAVAVLTGLLDEYDRLTGRTQHEPCAAERAQQAYLTAVTA